MKLKIRDGGGFGQGLHKRHSGSGFIPLYQKDLRYHHLI